MMNDVQRESLAFVETCMTLSGCDRNTAEETLRELAEATVGTPCPLYRAKARLLDRLEKGTYSDQQPPILSPETRLQAALDYARSFMATVRS